MHKKTHFFQGAYYLFQGFKDLFRPRLKRYLIIPLLANICIFGVLFYYGIYGVWQKFDFLLSGSILPGWLHTLIFTLKIFLMTLLLTMLLSLFGMVSTLIANLIVSPFNGLLSEKLSKQLHRTPPASPAIIHTLRREIKKFLYYLPRALLIGIAALVLHFIPPLNLITPFMLYAFAAWMMAIQYIDYPADNFHIPFKTLVKALHQQRGLTFGFGLMIAIFSSIPLLNLCVMPAAVLGATRIWHDHLES